MSEIKRIFVSHKASNGKIVSDMLNILKSGMTGVEFFLSEQIEPGDNWRYDIVKEIKTADCLLLLYLDPDQDWSWCMFEAGLFSAYKPKMGRGDFIVSNTQDRRHLIRSAKYKRRRPPSTG